MMNIALMWWAFEETGDKRFYNVGFSEATGVQRFFLRDDGSTALQAAASPGEPVSG